MRSHVSVSDSHAPYWLRSKPITTAGLVTETTLGRYQNAADVYVLRSVMAKMTRRLRCVRDSSV